MKSGEHSSRKTEWEEGTSVGPWGHCWATAAAGPQALPREEEVPRLCSSLHSAVNNSQPKTFQLHFPDKCKHFICVLPNTHSQSWFLWCTLWAGNQDTHAVPTFAMYSLCVLGKVTKPLWSRILKHKKVLIHLLFILQRSLWGSNEATDLKLLC